MHPLPAVAHAAVGSFSGMLRNHGTKRKTDRNYFGEAAIILIELRREWREAIFGGNVFPADVNGPEAQCTTCYPGRSPQARPI